MTNATIISQTVNLLGGELRDPPGEMLTGAARPVVEVHDAAAARAALAEGRRVAIPIPLSADGRLARLNALCMARLRINAARRRLDAAGARRLRTLAVMTSAESLFLVYELGETIQPYIEDYVVLQPVGASLSRTGRRLLQRIAGVTTLVDLVVIVGDPA